jgi:polysaccharide pyruvyl transferase WcaK-like protein
MKYLVASANGYGNVGDDICGYGAKYLIEKCDPEAVVTVTAPPFDESLAAQADVLVLGGGGIFYDGDRANVENYLSYMEYGQKHGKKTAVLGVGVQGINTDWGKKRYRGVLNKCDLITVRSPRDKELLDKIGIKDVYATQDLGFLADEWVSPVKFEGLRKFFEKKSDKPRLGLSLVDLKKIKGDAYGGPYEAFTNVVEAQWPRLNEVFDIRLFVHSRDDSVWYGKLAENPGVKIVAYDNISDFPRFWREYTQLDMMIGVRFHSIILGLIAGKPVVGMGTADAKQQRLSEYNLPTLKSQFVRFQEEDRVAELFTTLPEKFAAGVFKPLTDDEQAQLKERAGENGTLLSEKVANKK